MKISACMIAKNEEANIAKCINSYKDVIDEVIVVDTGSTDRTVAIAEELGAKVFYFKWINDFAKAKNYALSKASGDWIIFLDADEYFDIKKSKYIPNIIKKYGKGKTKLIGCKLINIDEKSGEQVGTSVQTRIFKKDKSIYYVSSIHERLHSDEKNVRAIYIPKNELEIYHTGYSRDKITEKAERNLIMLLKELEKKPIDSSLYYFLCDTYLTLKKYKQCIYYGELFLKNRVNMIGLNSKVYQNIIAAMIKSRQNWKDIETIIRQALIEFPEHPIFHMFLSERFFATKQYEKALEGYKRTIKMQLKYTDIEINYLDEKVHEIEYAIALIFDYRNDEQKALEYYISALNRKKQYTQALDGVLKLSKSNDAIEVVNILEQLYDKENPEQLKFLIERLTKQRYKKTLAFYVNWMHKKFKYQDFSLVIMFLTNEKYEQAFKYFYEAYIINYQNSYAKLAIISGYLYESNEMLLKMKNIVKPSYKRIIEALLSIDKEVVLYAEDLKDYLDILAEIIKLEKKDFIVKYIYLKYKFKLNMVTLETAIGSTLKDNRCYKKAIEQYNKALISQNKEGKEIKYLYFIIGYCYYKIRNFDKTLIHFEEALKRGYLKNDIKEFLQWTKEQVTEERLKTSAQTLINKFDSMILKKQAEET